MKKILIGAITAGMLLVGATGALAATFKSPAEIYSELKGVTVEEAYAAKAAGNSYGKLANDAGLLEEFKAEMIENRKALIQERVANGQMTQEQGDAIIKNMETNMANCDGTFNGRGGRGQGIGGMFGKGRGMGAGGGCWNQGAGNSAPGTTK
jgi:hypothetical protein